MSKGNINYKYLKRRKSWFRRNLTLVIFIAVAYKRKTLTCVSAFFYAV